MVLTAICSRESLASSSFDGRPGAFFTGSGGRPRISRSSAEPEVRRCLALSSSGVGSFFIATVAKCSSLLTTGKKCFIPRGGVMPLFRAAMLALAGKVSEARNQCAKFPPRSGDASGGPTATCETRDHFAQRKKNRTELVFIANPVANQALHVGACERHRATMADGRVAYFCG